MQIPCFIKYQQMLNTFMRVILDQYWRDLENKKCMPLVKTKKASESEDQIL